MPDEQEVIKKAILQAHYDTTHSTEPGEERGPVLYDEKARVWREEGTVAGNSAGILYYTKEQLRRKASILLAA